MKKLKILLLAFSLSTLLFLATFSTASAEIITVSGIVNNMFQIEAEDGQIYELEANDVAEELVTLEGQEVEVTGDVRTEDNVLILTVIEYKLKT